MSNVDPDRDRTGSDPPPICVLCSVARIVTRRGGERRRRRLEMDRDIWKSDSGRAKRLSTIAEYSEAGIDDNDHRPPCNEKEEKEEEEEPSIPRGDPERTLEDQAAAVEYFLVDDSPMAKFSRSIKWIYKKVSLESSSSVKSSVAFSPFFHSTVRLVSAFLAFL